MQPLRNLRREHDEIGRLLEALDRCARRLSSGDAANRSELVQLAQAIAILLDEVHFDKEEQILLPALVRSGCDWESEPLRRTRDEHARERHLLAALRHAGACSRRWREPQRRAIARTAGELIESQSRLMDQQERGLYEIAGRRLGEGGAAVLQARLEGFDARLDGKRLRAARRIADRARRSSRPSMRPVEQRGPAGEAGQNAPS